MPKFKVKMFREVKTFDEVVRVIEAPSQEAATDYARELCSDYNLNCPDDAKDVGPVDCDSWQVDYDDVVATEEPADETVRLPDDEDAGDAEA